jgi:hypothetical protein
MKDPNYENYKNAINQVLATHPHFTRPKTTVSRYNSFSESVRRDEEYWKDPEAFRRKQTLE